MHKRRVLTSAPVLTLAVIGFVLGAWHVEHQMRRNNESLLAFALSSDDGQEFDARITSSLPASLTTMLDAVVVDSSTGTLNLDRLAGLADFQTAPVDQQRAMQAYLGRRLASRNRFEDAFPILDDLTAEARSRHEAAFAYAETLKGLGETDAALSAYRALISDSPNHQAGHINYAIELMRLDRHDQARPVLDRAIAITRGRRKGKSYSLLGILLMELAVFDQAEEAFRQSIEYRPGHAPTWRRLARAQARAGTVGQDQVVASFERAGALSPGNGLVEAGLADFYVSVGRFDDALVHYRNASRGVQSQGDILLNRAINLILSERPSAARNVVRTLKSLNLGTDQTQQVEILDDMLDGSVASVLRRLSSHTDSAPLSDRAAFLQLLGHLEVGDFEEAAGFADRLVPGSLYEQPARFMLARQHYRDNRPEPARVILSDLVSRNEHSPIFWLYLGRAQADPAAALAAHRRAHELLPGSGRMSIEYAQALDAVGQTDTAVATLFAYLDEHPNEARALRALAGIYDGNGQLDRAEQVYRIIFDLNTGDVSTGTALAEIQFRAGKFETALATLDSLIELRPSRVSLRQRRAETLLRLNRASDAQFEFERILRLDPGNEPARIAFAAYAG